MDFSSIRGSAAGLAKALQRRWRTAPSIPSVTLTQGVGDGVFALPAVGGTRVQLGRGKLNEVSNPSSPQDPYGFEGEDTPHEPRFLKMAKDELRSRKDLRCKDCGFLGLPSPDMLCPNCGGQMEDPRPASFDMAAEKGQEPPTAEAVRRAVRELFADRGSLSEFKCGCREPKQHRDCAYCGCGGPATHICGQCKEVGIDGPVIRGTEGRTCAAHKKVGRPEPELPSQKPMSLW